MIVAMIIIANIIVMLGSRWLHITLIIPLAVAVLGTTGPKSSAEPLFENFLLTKIILQVLIR